MFFFGTPREVLEVRYAGYDTQSGLLQVRIVEREMDISEFAPGDESFPASSARPMALEGLLAPPSTPVSASAARPSDSPAFPGA